MPFTKSQLTGPDPLNLFAVSSRPVNQDRLLAIVSFEFLLVIAFACRLLLQQLLCLMIILLRIALRCIALTSCNSSNPHGFIT